MERQLRPGDVIVCQGLRVTIADIAYQEPWEWRNAYYLEFRDTNGVYRSWKQNFDGGKAILMPTPEEEEEEIEKLADEEETAEELEATFPDLEDLLAALFEDDDLIGIDDPEEFDDDWFED